MSDGREMYVDGLKLDGRQLCMGCEEEFVVKGYCVGCERLNEAMERKRIEGRRFLEEVERHDAGVVPFEALERSPDPSPLALAATLAGGLGCCATFCVGLWFTCKAVIGALLWLSGR